MTIKSVALVSVLLVTSAFPGLGADAVSGSSPDREYSAAIAAMRDLPVPKGIAYTARLETDNVTIQLSVDRNNQLTMGLGLGGSHSVDDFPVSDTPAAGAAQIRLNDTLDPATSIAIFDPTWSGAYRWLRFGVSGRPSTSEGGDAAPDSSASTSPGQPIPETSPGAGTVSAQPAVIGSVATIGSSFYAIEERGSQACPSGSPGLALHLMAKERPDLHPLTDVTIDAATRRFCMMRFAIAGRSGMFGATGFVELHFGECAGFWLVTDGAVDVEGRFLGVGLKHGSIKFSAIDPKATSS